MSGVVGYGPRLLVVDDEPANVTLLESALRKAGLDDVRGCTDPVIGLELVDTWQPDVVLLDLHMPVLDGYQFLERVRAAPSQGPGPVPVIVLTADAGAEARHRALDRGATDYLTKPLDLLEVNLRVRNVLETRRLQYLAAARTAQLEAALEQLWIDRLAEREDLIGRIVAAHEIERERLAREIHDDTVQTLFAISLRLDALSAAIADDRRDALVSAADACRSATERLRQVIFDLRSPVFDECGLVDAIVELAEATFPAAWQLDADAVPDLDEATAIQLYRIAQEALINAHKHASCSAVTISVSVADGGIELVVADDGSGFDPSLRPAPRRREGHIGLDVMHERAAMVGGTLRVDSVRGEGTTVQVTLPFSLGGDHG